MDYKEHKELLLNQLREHIIYMRYEKANSVLLILRTIEDLEKPNRYSSSILGWISINSNNVAKDAEVNNSSSNLRGIHPIDVNKYTYTFEKDLYK